MNLLKDEWFPVIRRDGRREKVAICNLLEGDETNPIVDFESPRADFRNAIYQLLIGIVQVAAAPSDEEAWLELWDEPYSADELREKILSFEECFEIDSEGPAFMQDLDKKEIMKKDRCPVFRLMLGAPGENTVKKNSDHFVKECLDFQMDGYWAAVTLFLTQQVAGPPDGGGHREGLRGSGTLTTLLTFTNKNQPALLWNTIWLNIFPEDEVSSWNGNGSTIFPWTTKTISSTGDKTTGFDSFHPLSVYWGMPWRVRFELPLTEGTCHLSGQRSQKTIKYYRRLKHGNMYSNHWRHPLTPYKVKPDKEDSKGKKDPKPSMRAKHENFCYSHWAALCLGNDEYAKSRVLSYFHNNREQYLDPNQTIGLWASGFDMVSGEATVNNWYEAVLPLIYLPPDDEETIRDVCRVYVQASSELAKGLENAIKDSWFSKDEKGKSKCPSIDPKAKVFSSLFTLLPNSFWQNTEPKFYELLQRMVENVKSKEKLADYARQWQNHIIKEAFTLFDQWALAQQEDGLNMKRVVAARKSLGNQTAKVKKILNNLIEVE